MFSKMFHHNLIHRKFIKTNIIRTYQYGFQDPKEWDYCYTIQNKCGEVLFNLTDSLCMEYAKDSGCNGYDDKSKNYSKKRSIFNKRHEDKCEVGPWGTKP
ncbi:14546_t:CDS:2 [Gigaspora margarita]|uniref:14546_t:CDS:1 n=1 Tax=Gigaspora margarita TaxID=4874 RepID=A0ABN7US40_GIGMA|nr:14546_t:CDS:2 [Gigaspora margarita]